MKTNFYPKRDRKGVFTYFILCAVFIFSMSAHVDGQITYSTSFDGCNAATCTNWNISGGFSASITATSGTGYSPCNTASAKSNIYGTSTQTILVYNISLGNSNGANATLGFSYKCIDYSTGAATPANSCTFTVERATAIGGPWTSVGSVNNVSSATCQSYVTPSFNPPAGQPIFIRIRANRTAGDFWAVMDNINFNQVGVVACAGNPAASNTLSSSPTVCSGANFTLSLSTTYNETGITYQWQSADDNAFTINVTNLGTAATQVTSQTTAKYYRCIVTCTNGGGFVNSTPILVNMDVFTNCYCAAGATSTSFEKISNVTFNTINNNSVATAGYENFTGISTTVFRGDNYAFSSSFTGTSYATDQVIVWIDYNQNGLFTDPGEQVLATGQQVSPWTGNITISPTALTGPTRMRVRLHDAGDGPNATPCGNSGYGQVEDYTVNIQDNICGGTPNNGSIPSSINICNNSSASITATGVSTGIGISYQWEEFNGSWVNAVGGSGATTTTYTTPNITSPTTYRITTTCSNSGQSASSNSIVVSPKLVDAGTDQSACFGTVNLAATYPYAAIQLNEGFDDITTLSGLGWVQNNLSNPLGIINWFQGTPGVFNSNSGATNAYIGANFNNAGGGAFDPPGTISNWLITPELSLVNGTTISFYTRTTDVPTYPDRLEIRMSTNGGSSNVGANATSVGDFTTVLLTINPTLTTAGYPNTWTQYTATVSGLGGPTQGRIAFRYFVTSAGPSLFAANSDYIGIDDVVISTPQAFSWSGPGIVSGGNTLTPTVNATGLYTITVTDGACTLTDDVNVTIAPCTYTWTGNVNTDWNNAGNWSTNIVPSPTDNVIIPDVSMASNNFPLVNFALTINDLTVSAGAFVNIAPTGGLVLDGTLNASAGTFTLQSDASGTAYLDDFTLGGTVIGNIRVQRYNPIGVTGYRQLGAPVQVNNISQVSGFTVSGIPGFVIPLPTCDPNYVAANSPYGSWVQLVENATPQYNCSQSLFQVLTGGGMTNGRGYYMDAPGGSTFTFTGAPNTGPVSFGLTHANAPVSNGWNMVSNPYPSPLAWETGNVPAGIDGIGKLWVTSGAYTGTFQDLDPNIPGTAVAIGQAFQVRVTNPGGTPSFNVDNSDRTTSPPSFLFAGGPGMVLNIDILGNGFADLAKVRFIDGATTGMDAMFDSPKMLGNANQPMVYSVWNGKNYSTNSFEALNDVYTLPLGVKLASAGQHSFVFSNMDQFPASAFIYLEDVQTGIWQDVRANDTYSFTQPIGTNETRFLLHFFPPVKQQTVDATCDLGGSVTLTEVAPATWNYVLKNSQNIAVSQGILDASQTIGNLPVGTYTLTLTEQTSGYVAVETVSITGAFPVTVQALSSTLNVETGQEVQFTANSQNAVSWNWNFGDGNTSTDQNPLHLYNAAGVYTVTVIAGNGTCDDQSELTLSAYSTASVQDNFADAGVKMWNDNTMVYIQFDESWLEKTTFSLYDVAGKRVFQQTLNKASGTQMIDCGVLATGTYTVELSSKSKAVSRKTIMGIK